MSCGHGSSDSAAAQDSSVAATGTLPPMPNYGECQSAEIAASPEDCYAALTDFDHLPDWQGAVREARVLERDADGRGSVVEYVVDAKVKTVRYRLRQVHQPPGRLGC